MYDILSFSNFVFAVQLVFFKLVSSRFQGMNKLVLIMAIVMGIGILHDVHAQTEQYKFKHISINDGLSHNEVTDIFKDSKGFVWVGTASGLNRYDGYNVKMFRHDPRDSTSLAHNTIMQVFETPDGGIGVVTPLGLSILDVKSETFDDSPDDFFRQFGVTPGSLNDIIKDPDGRFWFIEPLRLICFDPLLKSGFVVKNRVDDVTSIVPQPISNFTFDRKGNGWVIHNDGVIEKLAISASNVTVARRIEDLAVFNHKASYNYLIIADEDGDPWIVASNDNQGLYYYSMRENKLEHFTTSSGKIRLSTNIVGGIVLDNQGMIWIGTDHGGVNIIDKKKFSVTYVYHRDEDEKTLSQNSAKTIYRDDQGIIWIGTYKRGVSYYHENIYRFEVYKHFSSSESSLPYADVNRFVEDEKGNLWIGTNGGGLIYFDRSAGKFKQYRNNPSDPNSLSSDVIVSLCIDSDKNLWIGTYYEGLNMFDGKKFVRYNFDPTDPNSLSGRSVWEVFEDSRKNLWIGTLEGGVNIFDREKKQFRRLPIGGPNAIQSTYIAAITEDRAGNMWFGTAIGIDILNYKTQKFTHYQNSAEDAKSLSNNRVLDIREDSSGRIWIGTGEGLNLFDPVTKEFKSFWKEDGLPHNSVLTVLEDKQGNIWMSTPGGLTQMKINDQNGKLKLTFNRFTELDGLQGLQFNENAAYKTRNGELVFGGPYGFNIFNSDDLKENAGKPRIVFTDFQLYQKSIRINEEVDGQVILNESITGAKEIILPPNKNFFSIEFSALNYLHPEKNQYRYKLEGLNSEWLPVDNNTHKITFTSLNPGSYKLRVSVSSDDGSWGSEEAVMALTVLPPFWKTKAAFFVYAILLVGVLFTARKLIQQREQMKFAIEQERQEAIRMHELDMMKIKFFTNVSHEFRTPLTLILTPLEKLIRQGKDAELKNQHQLIHRNAKRLLNLVNQLLDFRKMEVQEIRFNPSEGDILRFIREAVYSFSDLSEKKSIDLDFRTTIDSLETIFDQDKLEKILFNLLSNAFKFTPEHGKVSVNVQIESQGEAKLLRVDVADTGIGIPPDKHERIFERFFQNDLPQTMVNQGSGIGLSITKEFVKIHGGRIELASAPGRGSCFSVFLPVKDVFKVEAKELSATPVVEVGADVPELESAVEVQMNNEAERKHTLLLIEDSDDFRFYLKDNLKLLYSIVEARNGVEGWKQTLSHQPDLIVSDIMMPEMNGIDLCKKIKSDERVSHIPVILLTARSSEEQKLEGFETGADEYVTKPFNFEILESRIRNLIHRREKSQKAFRKTLDVKASELNITPLDTKFIENALRCVEQNVSSPDFSVEHLGRELGISRAYLYKKILALTGKSPLEFIRTIRLQHAAQLLEKSQLTVSEVAYKVGFNNPKYFTKYFKEEFSVLPSHYAATRRK
jgi:signal transduction histidine kinase/ligand-binding sensor domain-containing protein/DNA-binding response OmpR family regulator